MRPLLLLLLALCLWLGAAVAGPAAPGEALVVALRAGTLVDLDDGSSTAITQLPTRRTLQPRHHRRFRLTLVADLPDPAAAPLWSLYFVQLNEGGELRVNGTVVGAIPGTTPERAVLFVRPFMFVVAPELLRAGRNEISLQWATHDTLQHLSTGVLGPADVVRPHYERRLFWQNTMAQVGFDFALVAAALLLGMHVITRREKRYLLMGVTSLGWALICLAYFLPPMPAWLYPYWHLLRLAGIAATACSTWLFLMEEVAPERRLYPRLAITWASLGPAGHLLHFWLRDAVYSAWFETTWGIVLLLLGAYPIVLLAQALWRQWNGRRAVFLLAAVAGLLAGVADVGMAGAGSSLFGNTGYIAQATSPIWFSAIVLVLLGDFARFLSQQKRQNELLARRLREQQNELQQLHIQAQRRERQQAALQERQRIMQDMHDGLGSQLVSSLALSERGALDAAQTSALLRDCIDDLRLAIDSLAGSEEPFAVMLGNLRFRMSPRLRAAGIALRWNSAGLSDDCQPPPAQTLALLRILQECLANALRHSGARQITVTVEGIAQALQLRVEDDGHGFDALAARRGKGLSGMEKRARALGATLQFAADAGGTVVELRLALS